MPNSRLMLASSSWAERQGLRISALRTLALSSWLRRVRSTVVLPVPISPVRRMKPEWLPVDEPIAHHRPAPERDRAHAGPLLHGGLAAVIDVAIEHLYTQGRVASSD